MRKGKTTKRRTVRRGGYKSILPSSMLTPAPKSKPSA